MYNSIPKPIHNPNQSLESIWTILKDFFLAKSRGRLFQAKGPCSNSPDWDTVEVCGPSFEVEHAFCYSYSLNLTNFELKLIK